MSSEKKHYGLDYDTFFEIIHNLYDEIWVYDNNYNIVYVNNACRRHYALSPEEIIGRNFSKLEDEKMWSPSILPHVYEEKKLYAIKQTTSLGSELINIAKPIFDEEGEIKYVAMSVRDPLDHNQLFHPDYGDDDLLKIDKNAIIFDSKKMKHTMSLAKKISQIDSNCLISGESGTGKTMLARYIHSISERKNKPFVCINCATIPAELIESELFGYVKGSFTGAKTEGKIGLLESADGGTVLFDEISELPYNMQAKLLTVLQEKEFFPIGSTVAKKVDIKIIAATNRDLIQLAANKLFREDLFYRLNIFEIYMPPLRERENDVEKLIFYFLNFYSNKYDIRHEFSQKALEILTNYSWPGNVRELAHTLEQLIVTVDDIVIDTKHLPSRFFKYEYASHPQVFDTSNIHSYSDALENFEKKIIEDAYKKYKSTRKVGAALNITQSKASTLIRKYITNKSE